MTHSRMSTISVFISWSLSLFFFWLFFSYIGFPPRFPTDMMEFAYLAIALFLFLFPFVSKIRIGNFALEKQVEETKKELVEHKQLTYQMLSAISANLTSVASAKSIVNVYPLMGESHDPIKPTPIDEMKPAQTAQSNEKLEYFKNRMVYSFADENARENINPKELNWAYYSDDLFWLGQNLTYIKAILISGGPKSMILRTLGQAYAHLKNLGIEESLSALQITSMRYQLHKMSDSELDAITREKYARAIQECIYRIGALSYEFQEINLNEELGS